MDIQQFQDDFLITIDPETISDALKDKDPADIAGLLITIDATHAGYINRNFYYYGADGMERSVKTWVTPYKKPMLKYHKSGSGWFSDSEDPLGRVLDAEFIRTSKTTGFIRLQVLVTDPDAIEKIKDGRFLTVSTAQRPMGPVTCSICECNIIQDGLCEHERGRKYVIEKKDKKGKVVSESIELCYFIFSDLEYREVSIVNEPADQDLKKKRAAVITKWEAMDSAESAPVEIYGEDDVVHNVTVMMVDGITSDEPVSNSRQRKYCDGTIWTKDEIRDAKAVEDDLMSELGSAKLPTYENLSTDQFCGPGRSIPVSDCAHVAAVRRLLGRPKYSDSIAPRILAAVDQRAKALKCESKDNSTDSVSPLNNVLEMLSKRTWE